MSDRESPYLLTVAEHAATPSGLASLAAELNVALVAVTSPAAAIRAIAERPPMAVWCVVEPWLDELEPLVAACRPPAPQLRIPVILSCAAVPSGDWQQRWQAAGVTDILSPPEEAAALRHRLELYLDWWRAAAQSAPRRERRRWLATAVEQASEAILITDTAGIILYVNPAFTAITGYPAEQACGQTPRLLRSGRHDAAFYARMWATIRGGEVWRGQVENRRQDGSLYYAEATITPVRDRDGRIVNFVSVTRDVTPERELQRQLRQAQKMDAIGRLAGGVAHDFNNMLTVMLAQSERLLNDLPRHSTPWSQVESIYEAARRAAQLTGKLLSFSREKETDRRLIDLSDLLRNFQKILSHLIGERVELEVQLPAVPQWVKADPGQIEQVVLNLVVNARDAMPDGGRLRLALQPVLLDQWYVASHLDATVGPHVLLTVADTGEGIDESVISDIFEPFFTTKGPHGGTGLGLAIVYGIVKRHGGHIGVASQLRQGTTFSVYLPAVVEAAGVAAVPERLEAPPRGHETILVVEDEQDVLVLISDMLKVHGYQVLATHSPTEACRLGRDYDQEIHLLISDMIMPEMGGRDVARLLKDLRPAMKVLFISGYAALSEPQAALANWQEFMQKPFGPGDLLRRVRGILDRPAPTALAGNFPS